MTPRLFFFLAAAAVHRVTWAAASSPPPSEDLDASYTFDRFVSDFERSYERGSEEYLKRKKTFDSNLKEIMEHNHNAGGASGSGHRLGINHFADMDESEMRFGFDKSSHPAHNSHVASESRRLAEGKHLLPLPFNIDPVESLPDYVDWRKTGVVTPVKDQGGCGSCWAFATAETLESHVAKETGTLFELSPQELVSCVANPQECGGQGGCTGATAEIALDFVAEEGNGIAQEFQIPYDSYHGQTPACPSDNDADGPSSSSSLRGGSMGAVATIDGYAVLPSNDYPALMNVVAKWGPVVVAAAASPWAFYEKGVFSVNATESNPRNYDVNHAVQLVGYGTDEETGEDYWLARNSWRPTWGENGYIRLKRVDPGTLENPEDDCGVDTTPGDGLACQKDDGGNPIEPVAVKVCGTSGVLFDTVLAVGGRLV